MGMVASIIRQLFSPVRQAWRDYKIGRMMRKSVKNDRKGPEQLECKVNENDRKEPEQSKGKGNETQPRPTKSLPQRRWKFDRTAEFPWRLKQVVQEESNWRGTWILEVKDMVAMDWGMVEVPKESGKGIKHQRRPTRQLPFTPEMQQNGSIVLPDGGQDDLMVWLGKP